MIAQFHGGIASAQNKTDDSGVVITIELPVMTPL
jgi:hypothetical protein